MAVGRLVVKDGRVQEQAELFRDDRLVRSHRQGPGDTFGNDYLRNILSGLIILL